MSNFIISRKVLAMKTIVKIISLISIYIMVACPVFAGTRNETGYDITNKIKVYDNRYEKTTPAYPDDEGTVNSSYMYGDENYPLVGVTTYGPIFLDKTSCKYEAINNVGYISCLVYYGGGGADGHGNAAKHTPVTIRFSTWKTLDKRVIKFLSAVNKNGKNITEMEYKSDNGFLNGLFWYSTGCIDISKDLDN